jgi:hypothetical protein
MALAMFGLPDGVPVAHRTPHLAIMVGGVVEEAAQAGINGVGPERPGSSLQVAQYREDPTVVVG